MELKELRLGNLVFNKNTITEVETIFPFNINVDFVGDDGISISELKPIPLTEEWLLKFGFKKGDEWTITIDDSQECFEWFYGDFFYTGGEGVKFGREIKTVHQLQNFYFALTGKELEIK